MSTLKKIIRQETIKALREANGTKHPPLKKGDKITIEMDDQDGDFSAGDYTIVGITAPNGYVLSGMGRNKLRVSLSALKDAGYTLTEGRLNLKRSVRGIVREANTQSPGTEDLQATQPKQAPIQKASKPSKKALDQYKVRQFFKKLESSDTLMQLMTFTTPLQQAQAIVKFAELVGVPETRIPVVVQQLRALSKQKNK